MILLDVRMANIQMSVRAWTEDKIVAAIGKDRGDDQIPHMLGASLFECWPDMNCWEWIKRQRNKWQ